MPLNKKNQSGNVFVLLLAGIFLFGALMFTFTRGSSKGANSLSKHQARVAAQEILNYALSIETAVNRIRRNACSENQISFENSVLVGYVNANAPIDNSCHIFEDNGGKVSYISADNQWTTNGETWRFNGQFQVTDIGSTCASTPCADLNIQLAAVKSNICELLNDMVGLNTPTTPIDGDYDLTEYQGSFVAPTDVADEVGSNILSGRSSGCFFSTADGHNVFYHVLLAR